MSIKEKIYQNMPLPLQNAMISLYGWSWQKRRFGGIYEEEYKGYKDREYYSKEQWDEYMEKQLTKMLLHAYNTVPFYKEYWTKAGLALEKIKTITPDTIDALPYLEKDDLRKYGKTKLLSEKREPNGTFFASSGSTGTPTSILLSHPMHQRWSAGFEARIRNWAGLSRHNKRGMIGGRRIIKDGEANPPFYRYNFVEKQVYFSAYHISKNNANNYLHAIKKYQLDYMTGYAASNFFLARFFDELKLDVPPLKAVITSSEKLTPEMREMFEKVYQCKTYDSYSGVEDCGLISECEHGGLHVSPDMGLIEFLNEDGKPAKAGEPAEMVCTGILNFDQPLIRYRIGDMAVLEDRVCSCGRSMPLVKEIVGRTEDVVVGKDGREMVRFHGIFIDLPEIVKAQVIQDSYVDFVINVMVSESLTSEALQLITKRMQSQLGDDINVVINQVDNIPLGPNGKFKAVISNLKR